MKNQSLLSLQFALVLFLSVMSSQLSAQAIFDKFDWLSTKVQLPDCQGAQIDEYQVGPYSFINVARGDAQEFYFQDGTLYCTGTPSYDCVKAYGFSESQIGLQYTCTDTIIIPQGCDALPINEKLICDFPWLTDKVDLVFCNTESVVVYQSGVHQYLNVTTATESKLYYQDGSLFCTNGTNYDCPSLYGFASNNIVDQSVCGDYREAFTGTYSGTKSNRSFDDEMFTTPIELVVSIVENTTDMIKVGDAMMPIRTDGTFVTDLLGIGTHYNITFSDNTIKLSINEVIVNGLAIPCFIKGTRR